MEICEQDRLKLIHFLNFVCDYEASKPIEEMDEELIKSCVKVLLELQDKHVKHSPEFIDEQVRKIFHKEKTEITEPETVKTNKKQINKKKVWLVAACIAILVALFSIVSFANDWNVFDFLSEKFGSVHSAPIYTKIDFNGISVVNSGKNTEYTSIEEAFAIEKLNTLYPCTENEDHQIIEIVRYQQNNNDCLSYVFAKPDTTCKITLNSQLNGSIKKLSNEKIEINNKACFVIDLNDASTVQIYFEHKNNVYQFNGNNKQILINLINSLEEFSYEN